MTCGLAREWAAPPRAARQPARFAPPMVCRWLFCAVCSGAPAGAAAQQVVFEGDAVPVPLTASPADAMRGKAAFVQREKGHCILCHVLPDPEVRFAGNVGPPMAGIGVRLSVAQLRGRIVDPTRHDPDTVMPAYYRTENLRRVAPAYAGRTVLTAQDIEDVIAYLLTLR